MSLIDGFKLEFQGVSNGVYRTKESVSINHQTQSIYIIDGFRNLQRLFNSFIDGGGNPGMEDSNFSGVFEGFGAGIHTIQIGFQQFKGNTETWGNTNQNDEALTKMQELNHTITTTQADSRKPAELQVGEYNDSGGLFNPIPVALPESSLDWDPSQDVSTFTGTLTCFDAVDIQQAVDAQSRV